MDESHLRDPGHNPTSNELLLERYIFIAKESEHCSTALEQCRIEATHATQSNIPTNPMYFSKEAILGGERTWHDIPACRSFDGNLKLVMRLVRHSDQDEREIDGVVHWNSEGPKLWKAFQKFGGRKFSDTDWLQHIYQGSSKMIFTLRAQVAAESGLADAVRAVNNLVTAQVRKDTPSLIDVKGV